MTMARSNVLSLLCLLFVTEVLFFVRAHYITGPLEGLRCDAETVQEANSAQLHSILKEIANTTFFRLVRVDSSGEGYCPIDSVRRDIESAGGHSHTCGAAPQPLDLFSSSAAAPLLNALSAPQGEGESGGLCGVETERDKEKEKEKDMYSSPQSFSETVVTRISAEEQSAQREFPRDNECVIEGTFQIRPDYWLDLCDGSTDTSSSAEYVNLQLNPERNTGYNGSTVWQEMHAAVATLDSEEGRILQRLLSGYHAAVTTQIMGNYFPPARSSSANNNGNNNKNGKWRRNSKKFAETLFIPHEEYVKNMHFAFVLLSRSLFRIKDYLYTYSYATGNPAADRATQRLVQRLLDSSLVASCDSVLLRGFDESQMFSLSSLRREEEREVVATRFKKAFRRLSRMVHCVSCHRCQLHAFVSMHGLGVALKILLTEPALVRESLSRDDIVALLNTVHKLSESIELANDMMAEYYAAVAKEREMVSLAQSKERALASTQRDSVTAAENVFPEQQACLQFVATHRSRLSRVEEDALVHAILSKDPQIVLLARHFTEWALLRHALVHLSLSLPDAVVIGGGLAGLVTAVSLAERGGAVIVLEKLSVLGGNSAKASSGINSVFADDPQSVSLFLEDTLRSQGSHGERELAKLLVESANTSVAWLERESGLSLSSLGQLGGHRVARTLKPINGVVGAEIMASMIRSVRQHAPAITVRTHATVTRILTEGEGESERVQGVEYTDGEGVAHTLYARNVVLASGGFGFDRAGLLAQYRPDLVDFPTTLGAHTTGDGIRLAQSLSAALVDMDYVQLHPTGFVDPHDRDAPVKVLAAEVLRGVGGVMLDRNGERFVNELGTRKFVTDAMLLRAEQQLREKNSSVESESALVTRPSDRVFWLLLSEQSAAEAAKLTQIYVSRGLLRNVSSIEELRELIGTRGIESLREYSESERDALGRVDRRGLPLHSARSWLVGEVTPVVHYTMGGVKIDAKGRVLRGDGSRVEGLFAVGEVSGGVHGENRLGGNSLLECTVFGRIIGGEAIAVHEELSPSHFPRRRFFNEELLQWRESASPVSPSLSSSADHHRPREMTLSEVSAHSTPEDCWAAIEGLVYDLSRYAEDHPGGAAAIKESCGKDATQRFLVAHTIGLLADADFLPIGKIVDK